MDHPIRKHRPNWRNTCKRICVFQVEENLKAVPLERNYQCHWNKCRRKVPFTKRHLLVRHLRTHSFCAKSEQRLQVFRDQLMNVSRESMGRRYGEESKELVLQLYRLRRSWQWQHTQAASAAPLPTINTIIKEKNHGKVNQGIDNYVTAQLSELCKQKPEYDTQTKHTSKSIYLQGKRLFF